MAGSTARLLTAAGLVSVNRALLRLGVLRRVDGWRRAAGIVLRSEVSTFVMSAFGLEVWSDVDRGSRPGTGEAEAREHVAERLMAFLRGEPACQVRIRHGESEDVVEAAEGPACTLGFEPWVEGPARFVRPERWMGEPIGGSPAMPDGTSPLANIICRVHESGIVDVWMRVNHVGTDGVPMQEMLSRVEAAWGGADRVRYPSPEEFAPLAVVRPLACSTKVAEVQMFVDFAPLVEWRKRMNAAIGESMTLAAALLWQLGGHPAFEGLHLGTTVEIAATVDGGRQRPALPRGVGVVVVRPMNYRRREGMEGLRRYVADFNRSMERTRRRESAGCRILDAAAHVSPRMEHRLLGHALRKIPTAFGVAALTMVRDARVLGAPIAETGHRRGFLAIGSINLPTADGRKVGCVTIKGPAEVIAGYPRVMNEVVAGCGGSGG